MAILYKQTPFDTIIEGESLTEQEHIDSCDINKMIKNAARGMQIRGGNNPVYGYDDTTMDGLQFRIEKERLENELTRIAEEEELLPEALESLPQKVKEKFKFKVKKAKNATNDDKTTNEALPPTTPPTPPKNAQPEPPKTQ